MINTTVKNEISGVPKTIPHGRIVGHPSSKNIIRTTVSKPSCGKDSFISHMGECGDIQGGPTTSFVDSSEKKGKQA